MRTWARAAAPWEIDVSAQQTRGLQRIFEHAVRFTGAQNDHRRCQVPGCRLATYLDLHHVETRASGGENDASNLVTLCGAHPIAVHAGALVVTGSVDSGLEFWHADGADYGSLPAVARVLDEKALRALRVLDEKALRALRALGFGEREARRALDQTLREREPGAEQVLRRSLKFLTERSSSHSA